MAKQTSKSTKLTLMPTAGYLLIEPLEAQTQTVGGIYLPDTAGEKPQKGIVVAVGDDDVTANGTKKAPAKVGDAVIYKKWGGTEIKIDGKDFLFVKFEDILAVEVK